ncbi:response regulator transcription factor [Vibrio sinaloensis]|uniref:response regulator transcription factor n=1 Tax=Photobacterium sp. (strain ATCC 43367) TaxID=379097 RepID=UPI002045BE45|nr:response regulator [Vibrio sinaloensis]UPQ86964.1 response regulator [Vibrio sinaloensis]
MQNSGRCVYLVDDQPSVLESMEFMLNSYGYRIVSFERGEDFLKQAKLDQAGCVILDSRMPGLRGQEVHQLLNEQASPLSVIYLTGHGDVPMAVDALKAGAYDFFQKPVNGDQLVAAIDKALAESERRMEEIAQRQILEVLTNREKQVLAVIGQGLKNQQIADKLCVSLRTVEVHRSNIMKKLEVTSVASLMVKVGHLL